jgi:phosphoribosylanthranilate isomerase
VDDAIACVELGASAIGLNFIPASVRRVDRELGLRISRTVHEAAKKAGIHVEVVGVIADLSSAEARELVAQTELDCVQLHGDESPETLSELLPHAYKAVRIGSAEDVARASLFPGKYLLADAKVEGVLGGTGATFDWELVRELARTRKLTLAGGLGPHNVETAVRAIRPFCVDVASGVERSLGVKDFAKVRAFIEATKRA